MRKLYLVTPEGEKIFVTEFDKVEKKEGGGMLFMLKLKVAAYMPPDSMWVVSESE